MAKRQRGAEARKMNRLAVSPGFRSFVLDQLDELGNVAPRSMFGAVGLYRDGLFFGIVAGDVLYLKVDATTRADYERAGAKPFNPYPNRAGSTQYYAVPIAVLESPHELAKWARRALAVAEHPPPTRKRR